MVPFRRVGAEVIRRQIAELETLFLFAQRPVSHSTSALRLGRRALQSTIVNGSFRAKRFVTCGETWHKFG
jgi:hypothetical protein